jgi:hypothetical protein
MQRCIATKKNGGGCFTQVNRQNAKLVQNGVIRCHLHYEMYLRNGREAIEVEELKSRQKRIRDIAKLDYRDRRDPDDVRARDMGLAKQRQLIIDHRREVVELIERQRNGIVVNDLERLRQEDRDRIARDAEYMARRNAHIANEPAIGENGRLGWVANERQNVNTREVVEMTKNMINKILAIPPPPEEYRWNTNQCSKTPSDIIDTCGLSPGTAGQLMMMYSSNDSAYEMGNGIFGRVLDHVWQFIRQSPNAKVMQRILRVELNDCVVMCTHGNTSRICNTLMGFLEDLVPVRTLAEILGDELPKLMNIENQAERMEMANKIMEINNVPNEERAAWLEPLMVL